MCGSCCEGKGGIVLGPRDLARLATHLRLSQTEVIDKFGQSSGTKIRLKNGDDGFCIFFAKEKGCAVHTAKPDICAAWPFFKGNLVDKESLHMAKTFCPGINPDISHEDFVEEGMAYLKANHLLADDSTREANALIL